jgi:glycosyltransferase EpsF
VKIVYSLNSAKPGGMEKHVGELVSGMKRLGHEVFVICPAGELSAWYKDLGAEVKELSIKSEVDFIYIYELFIFFREKKPDVVHAHELKAVVNSLFASFLAGVKIRISHTHTPISEWKIHPIKKAINILINNIIVNTFATTEIALTNIVEKQKIDEGIFSSKIKVIPNGVEVNSLIISS